MMRRWVGRDSGGLRRPRRCAGAARAQAVRAVVRLPDERLRRGAHDRPPRRGRLRRDAGSRGRRSRHAQHLPHPRDARPRSLSPNSAASARSRTRGAAPAGRRGSSSPDASHRPRAANLRRQRAVDRRRRPAMLSPPARIAARAPSASAMSSTPISRSRINSIFSAAPRRGGSAARRHRLRHRAGGLRQVLHLLRRALYPRRRDLASARAHRGEVAPLAAAGVREVTLLGQNVNAWHGADAAGGPRPGAAFVAVACVPGIARAALHDQPSERHGRRPDRGASRS